MLLKSILLFLSVELIECDIIYEWTDVVLGYSLDKNDWRPTSFEYADDKFYLTFVDLDKEDAGIGVVAWFSANAENKSPVLKVHGDEDDYRMYSADGTIMAPMLVRMDPCGDLWVMDANVHNISGRQNKRSPSFHIYDTKSSMKYKIHHFHDDYWEDSSLFINLIFQQVRPLKNKPKSKNKTECGAIIAYIADFNAYHLLAYHYYKNVFHQYSHPSFEPDPFVLVPDDYLFNRGHREISGIYGLALAKTKRFGTLLFFHPLASTKEYGIPVDRLRGDSVLHHTDIRLSYEKGPFTEAGKTAFDPVTETFFFAELTTRKIGCLNLYTIIAKNRAFPAYGRYSLGLDDGIITDLKVDGQDLWILTYESSKVTLRKESIDEIINEAQCIFEPHKPNSRRNVIYKNRTWNSSSAVHFEWFLAVIIPVLIFIV